VEPLSGARESVEPLGGAVSLMPYLLSPPRLERSAIDDGVDHDREE
jgi:hypothetical protein